jgi:hypothetical protein
VASCGNCLSTFRDNVSVPFSRANSPRPLKMGPIRCPETSVNNYNSTLPNIAEERRYNQHHEGSLKSKLVGCCGYGNDLWFPWNARNSMSSS